MVLGQEDVHTRVRREVEAVALITKEVGVKMRRIFRQQDVYAAFIVQCPLLPSFSDAGGINCSLNTNHKSNDISYIAGLSQSNVVIPLRSL